jgi:hypothetical protein
MLALAYHLLTIGYRINALGWYCGHTHQRRRAQRLGLL